MKESNKRKIHNVKKRNIYRSIKGIKNWERGTINNERKNREVYTTQLAVISVFTFKIGT